MKDGDELELDWVWTPEEMRFRNVFVEFRRTISLAEGQRLRLRITADSRYFLYVNGKRIGMGPSRCWPNEWEYDTYVLENVSNSGKCVLAVLVNAYGQGTMQYIVSAPGLGIAIEVDKGRSWEKLGINGWKARPSASCRSDVPRMAMQMAFDEVYDARGDHNWNAPGYDDSQWPDAVVISPPHKNLRARTIPFLDEELVPPKTVLEGGTVRSTRYQWTLNLRPYLHLDDFSAAPMIYKGFLFTRIHSPVAQDIRFVRPHWYHQGPIYLNDQKIPALEPGFARAPVEQLGKLQKGWNRLLVPLPGINGEGDAMEFGPALFSQFSLNAHCDEAVVWKALEEGEQSTPWSLAGPFAFTKAEFDALRNRLHNAIVITPLEFAPGATARACREICRQLHKAADPESASLSEIFPADADFIQPLRETDIFSSDTFLQSVTDIPVREWKPNAQNTVLEGGPEPYVLAASDGEGESKRLLIDFGYEFVGDQVLDVTAGEGTVMDFHYFEFIQKDGRKNYAEDMNNTFRYVCCGGRQRYRSLVRRGYRYCWLTVRNQDKDLIIHNLAGCFTAYPQANIGHFQCDDELLNHIWKVGHHTLRCCSEDTYTDCPTYEQVFWVGDMRNEALVDWVVNGDSRLWSRCLHLAAKSLERSPIIESHVPSSQRSILPAWSFLWMRSCREYLLHTGDYKTSRELQPLKRNVEGVKQYINGRGLFEIRAWNMFDWAEMDTPDEGIVTHNNCFLVLALEEAAEFARWLDADDLAKDLLKLAVSVRKAINEHLWDETVQAYVDCVHKDGSFSRVFSQQTQTVALRAGIPDKSRVDRCHEIVMNPPDGFVKAGSPFFQFFILEILSEAGRIEEMVNDIRKHWGFMIKEGATTFWEMWSLKTGRLTRSHCHGWSSAPTYFLSSKILGIEPAEPGYRKIRFAPFAGSFEAIEGTIPSPQGLIRAAFRDGEWQLDLPDGVEVVENPSQVTLNLRDA